MRERWLHLLTRAALQVMSPQDTFAFATRLGQSLPRLEPTPRTLRTLGQRGSCLSRSITLAARITGARVAVGVKKSGYRAIAATRFGLRGPDAISAHAWIEVGGLPIDARDPSGKIIAYLG